MSVQAQAGPIQAWSVRGGNQLLAVFVLATALLAGSIGLAVIARSGSGTTTSASEYGLTHPVMVDRAAAPTSQVSASEYGLSHPVMVDRVATGNQVSASEYGLTHPVMADRITSGNQASAGDWSLTHPVMADR